MKKKELTLKHIALLSAVAVGISILTLAAGALFLWGQSNRKDESTRPVSMDLSVKTSESVREQISMADNSRIWLNSNSTLKYAPDYREERRARLSGQAYLKIRMQEKLFTLYAGNMTLFTYGASWRVDCAANAEEERVTLYAGELKVKPEGVPQMLSMSAGTELVIDKKTGDIEINKIKTGVKGPEWIVYKFEYMTFDHILYSISQYYEVSVTNNRPDLNNEPFTLTFDGNATLDEVMQILKAISNDFTYHTEGSELIIN